MEPQNKETELNSIDQTADSSTAKYTPLSSQLAFRDARRAVGRALFPIAVLTGVLMSQVTDTSAANQEGVVSNEDGSPKGGNDNQDWRCNIESTVERNGKEIYNAEVDLINLDSIEDSNLNLDLLNQAYDEFEQDFPDVSIHYVISQGDNLSQGKINQITKAVDNLHFSLNLIKAADPALASEILTSYAGNIHAENELVKLSIVLTPQWLMQRISHDGTGNLTNGIVSGAVKSLQFCESQNPEMGHKFLPGFAILTMEDILNLNTAIDENSTVNQKASFAWSLSILYHELNHLLQGKQLDSSNSLENSYMLYYSEMMAEASTVPFLKEVGNILGVPELGEIVLRNYIPVNFKNYFSSAVAWEPAEDGDYYLHITIKNNRYSQGLLLGQSLVDQGISISQFRQYEHDFHRYLNNMDRERRERIFVEGRFLQEVYQFFQMKYSQGNNLTAEPHFLEWGDWLRDFTRRSQTITNDYNGYFDAYEAWNKNVDELEYILNHYLTGLEHDVWITVEDYAMYSANYPGNPGDYVVPLTTPVNSTIAVENVIAVYDVETGAILEPIEASGKMNLTAGKTYLISPDPSTSVSTGFRISPEWFEFAPIVVQNYSEESASEYGFRYAAEN